MTMHSELRAINENISQLRLEVALVAQKTDTIHAQVTKINGRVGNVEDELAGIITETRINHEARADKCPYKGIIEALNRQVGGHVAVKNYTKALYPLLISIVGLLVAIATYLFIISS